MPGNSLPWDVIVPAGASIAVVFLGHALSKAKRNEDSNLQLRTELREEVRTLRGELRTVEDELDKWRGKYYELMDEFMKAKFDLAEALRRANEEANGDDPQA